MSSKDQHANALTKSLSFTRFLLLCASLIVRSLPFRLQGCVEEQVNKIEEHVNKNSSKLEAESSNKGDKYNKRR